jgi:hypothetical protein
VEEIKRRNFMKILHNGKKPDPEIAICGTATEFLNIGSALLDGQKLLSITGEKGADKFYSKVFNNLVFQVEPADPPTSPITIAVTESDFIFTGGAQTIKKLGQSFLNFFSGEVKPGAHFHLDYFDFVNQQLLAPTDCHITFEYRL